MNMSQYVRITEGLHDPGFLIPKKEFEKELDNIESNKDQYFSIYTYNQDHFNNFNEKKSIKGITDVTTDRLVFDLDCADNIDLVKKEALVLIDRIKNKLNISEKNIEIYWSGKKGIHLLINLKTFITPKQHANLALNILGNDLSAVDFSTADLSIYNASRILRVPNTRHGESKLFKISLTYDQLKNKSINEIKKMAEKSTNIIKASPVDIPSALLIEEKPKLEKSVVVENLESLLQNRPAHWKDYKWALLNAIKVESGERHNALMVLGATCRGLRYNETLTDAFLTTFDKNYAALTKQDENPKEIQVVLKSIFSNTWNGGQYSYENNPWLRKYCARLGLDKIEKEQCETINIDKAFGLFHNYATNIDELTIKTGIKVLDHKVKFTVGMSVGIVAAPSVGKTSIALQILNNVSNNNISAIFYSYDMFHALVYQKLIQKHLGLDDKAIFNIFKNNDTVKQNEIREKLKKEYKNIEFCFDSGQNVEQIRQTIKHVEQKNNNKVKLIVVDYNELILTEQNDATASSSFVAQKLREIANTEQICVISLFQPNKIAGSPSDPIRSYRQAKGSSSIEQSVSIMLGMYRPGFNPNKPDDDNFITINCLKNRMGKLFTQDLYWDGLTGTIRELTDEEKSKLEQVRAEREKEQQGSDAFGFS